MNKKNSEPKDYNEQIQRLFINFLISDPTAFALCQSIVKPDYFDDMFKRPVRYILEYAEEYKTLPSPEQIGAFAKFAAEKMDEVGCAQARDAMLDEIEQFCRDMALELLILDGKDLIDEKRYGEIEQRVKDAMAISLQRDLGIDYFADPKTRLVEMSKRNHNISTGWAALDKKLYGGFGRRTLNIFAGPPGTGKSLFLQNLALNYALGGYHVVFFTLELSSDMVSMRLDSMLSGTPTRDIFKKLDEVDLKVRLHGRHAERLQIIKLPEAGTNANTLRGFLKEYEIQTGIHPNVIIVDYLDLMHPNNEKIDPSDLFVKDKYTSEELRALADEWDAIGISASQLNRTAIKKDDSGRSVKDFDQSHIAGGLSKINTADNVMAIFITNEMRERGEYQLQFLKTRSAAAVGQSILLGYDPVSLRISDAPEPDPTKREESSIKDRVNQRLSSTVGQPPGDGGALRSLIKGVKDSRH